jgi:hypothetical protein
MITGAICEGIHDWESFSGKPMAVKGFLGFFSRGRARADDAEKYFVVLMGVKNIWCSFEHFS